MRLLTSILMLSPISAAAATIVDGPLMMAPVPSVDFTAIAVAGVGALVTVAGTLAVAFINARMKDSTSAAALSNAVNNSLGAVKQAVDAQILSHPLQVSLPGVSPAVAAGVAYVLEQAGPEAARFGVTPAAIVEKIEAKIGLAKLATPLPSAAPPVPAKVTP